MAQRRRPRESPLAARGTPALWLSVALVGGAAVALGWLA